MVDHARTFLALLWVMARMQEARNVTPPIRAMAALRDGDPARLGDIRIRRYTPRLTIVAECSSAETGVGATIAPSNQDWNGACADLVRAATESIARGRSASSLAPEMGKALREMEP
ncbi:MAG: hypothetical protein A4E29_01015 [Methanomassiliicoccales archaeon PtaB.Bin134]|nr:MAG: hypothetical protein A4E29_01015 [Methanomassiliicoccales archaeon PtaB.Bin134]